MIPLQNNLFNLVLLSRNINMLYIKRVLKWKNSYHFERRKEHLLIMFFYSQEEIFYCLIFFFSEMIRHFNRNIQRLKVNSKMKQLPKNAACLFFPTLTGIHLN